VELRKQSVLAYLSSDKRTSSLRGAFLELKVTGKISNCKRIRHNTHSFWGFPWDVELRVSSFTTTIRQLEIEGSWREHRNTSTLRVEELLFFRKPFTSKDNQSTFALGVSCSSFYGYFTSVQRNSYSSTSFPAAIGELLSVVKERGLWKEKDVDAVPCMNFATASFFDRAITSVMYKQG